MSNLFDMISNMLNDSVWMAPILALIAGVLTSVTPCSLSGISLMLGYIGTGAATSKKKGINIALVFALGSAVVFMLLGLIAALIGSVISEGNDWLHFVFAALLLLMALQLFGVVHLLPEFKASNERRDNHSFAGAFLIGIVGGLFASHCATPVLIALLAMVADRGSVFFGLVLLFMFSIGHGILAIVCGTSAGKIAELAERESFERAEVIIRIILGIVILIFALYMCYLGIVGD